MRCVAFLCVLLLTVPARALDCSQQPDPAAGQPISAEQLECIRLAIVNLRQDVAMSNAKLAQTQAALEASEATALITCPPPPPPVAPVVIASLVGVVVGVLATAALVLNVR